MYVDLPKMFSYCSSNDERSGFAYVESDTLYIRGLVSWQKVAYNLTFATKGKKTCRYCGRKLKRSKVTIDHMFPRDIGGVSIPINLLPSCSNCNSFKSNLNYHQYKIYRTLDRKKQSEFRRMIEEHNEKMRYKYGFDLPRRWISQMELSKIIARNIPENGRKQTKYRRVNRFVKNYHHVPNPLVVSDNNVLLEGHTIYWVALDHSYKEVPVIRLENVIVEL